MSYHHYVVGPRAFVAPPRCHNLGRHPLPVRTVFVRAVGPSRTFVCPACGHMQMRVVS
jgi:hypothetical protein